MNDAYLLLGSNIEPEKNILLALEYLQQNCSLLEISTTWQTKAVGSDAADFLNTAVHVNTEKEASMLKMSCIKHIESLLGRVRFPDKNAPRTIDLDIIIFNGEVMDQALFRYAHIMLPLAELLPDLIDPQSGQSLSMLASETSKKGLAKKHKMLVPPNE